MRIFAQPHFDSYVLAVNYYNKWLAYYIKYPCRSVFSTIYLTDFSYSYLIINYVLALIKALHHSQKACSKEDIKYVSVLIKSFNIHDLGDERIRSYAVPRSQTSLSSELELLWCFKVLAQRTDSDYPDLSLLFKGDLWLTNNH